MDRVEISWSEEEPITINCPVCDEIWNSDEPCEHLAFCWVHEAGAFEFVREEHADELLAAYLEAYRECNPEEEEGEEECEIESLDDITDGSIFCEMDELSFCNTIAVASSSGMACGPSGIDAYYGYYKPTGGTVKYHVVPGGTYFLQNFEGVSCRFTCTVSPPLKNGKDTFDGTLICDIDWREYCKDPIIKRFLNAEVEESWLDTYKPDMVPKSLFYNKLLEHMWFEQMTFEDKNAHNAIAGKYDDFSADFSDSWMEEQIFDEMLETPDFMEAFKCELDNPCGLTLQSALIHLKNRGLD